MPDVYPGNSHASRRREAERPRPERPVAQPDPEREEQKERKVPKVVTGRVVQRKRSIGSRLRDTFFSGGKEVGEHVLHEVILPAVKEVAMEAFTQFLERSIWGDSDRGVRRRTYGYASSSRPSGRSGYIQYGGSSTSNRFTNGRDDRREEPRYISRRERSGFQLKETVFETYEEADNVLRALENQAQDYGTASVVDFYDAIDITADWTDERWGWRGNALDKARVRRVGRGEFVIDLPAPERLDN